MASERDVIADPYAEMAELYDLEHDELEDDLGFYRVMASTAPGPVLEVGCGTGRVLQALAESGYRVVGVDRSTAMLAAARLRCARYGSLVELVETDVRGLALEERFGLVLFTLDTFAHLLSRSDQQLALDSVRRLLAPGGHVVIDLSAPDPATWLREDNLVISSRIWRKTDETIQKFFAREIDEVRQVQQVRFWYDRWPDGGALRRHLTELELRYFYPCELDLLLDLTKLKLDTIYGDYDFSPFEDASARLILVAHAYRGGRAR